MPLFCRISATDWCEGGWDLAQGLVLCRELKNHGVDLIDVSTGGLSKQQKIPLAPHYQVPFAKAIKHEVGVLTGAVGLITEPAKANQILEQQEADVVLLARELLRDPHWPLRAAHALGEKMAWPQQYERAKW
jgi:2,4-dienoyl-CoA reductase-like NADH-dependent reductase (Old Yellow Enzyme family)